MDDVVLRDKEKHVIVTMDHCLLGWCDECIV